MNIDAYLQLWQDAAKRSGKTRRQLEIAAGIGNGGLQGIFSNNWSPTARTLRKLQKALNEPLSYPTL